jgi:CBS-domain-containing membrane protein
MVDSTIQRLLEKAIDSPIKLQLCLLFDENKRLQGSAAELANRIYRDIWSTREALRELAEDGVLCVSDIPNEPIYTYRPRTEYIDAIFRLAQSYNEPIERDAIQRALREVASYAKYRRSPPGGTAFEMQSM